MANTQRHTKRKFGKAGGKYALKRKLKVKQKVYSCNLVGPNKLKICRRNIKQTYKRQPRIFVENISNPAIYNYLYSGSKLIYKLKKVKANNINGYRVINLDQLQDQISTTAKHTAVCERARQLALRGVSPLRIISELRTQGLASLLLMQCTGCDKKFQFETSKKLPAANGRYDVNMRAVWGCIVTGNGSSHLNEIMATLDAPGLSAHAFTSTEDQIGQHWEHLSQTEILAAGG